MPICFDEMVLVGVSTNRKNDFDSWFETEKKLENMEWLKELPAVYKRLGTGKTDPEPLPEEGCDLWGNLDDLDPGKAFVHPGAFFDYRSKVVGDDYGHQATYDEDGVLIESGMGAGTADKFNPFSNPISHLLEDFRPYVWAAQLDGNPVEEALFPDNFTRRLLHKGNYLNKYLIVLPVNPSGVKLEPGNCGTGSGEN